MTAANPLPVTLPSDTGNTGKLVDNVSVTNEASVTVARQAVSIGDAINGSNRMAVNSSGGAQVNFNLLPASLLTPFIINSSSGANISIGSAIAGQTIRLHRLILFVGGVTNITFQDGNGQVLSGPIPLYQGGDIILDLSGDPWYQSASGKSLVIATSQAVQLSGTAYYVQS